MSLIHRLRDRGQTTRSAAMENGDADLVNGVNTNDVTYSGKSYPVTANWGKWGFDDLCALLLVESRPMAEDEKIGEPMAEPMVTTVRIKTTSENLGNVSYQNIGKYAAAITSHPRPSIVERVSIPMLKEYSPGWDSEFGLNAEIENGIIPEKGIASSAGVAVATSQALFSFLRRNRNVYETNLPLEVQGFYATLGEAATTYEEELLADAIGPALLGGVAGTEVDETNHKLIITPYKTPSWNVLVAITRGVPKLGGRTSGVRRKTIKNMAMNEVPDYARRYRAITAATEAGDMEAFAYVTGQMHPVERSRASIGAFGRQVNPDFIASLDYELSKVPVGVWRSNGPTTFMAYDSRNPQTAERGLNILRSGYQRLGLELDVFRAAIYKEGTRTISLF